jgi:hypothetical protein
MQFKANALDSGFALPYRLFVNFLLALRKIKNMKLERRGERMSEG